MASNERSTERRRRIRERGSDRLALITGQIRSLDEPLSPKPEITTSSDDPPTPSGHPTSSHLAPKRVDVDSASESLKQKDYAEIPKNKTDEQNQLEPDHQKSAATRETETDPASVQTTSEEVAPSVQTTLVRLGFFSCKRINSCIIDSERTRAVCSLIIASFVLLSYTSYPLLGIDIVSSESSIIASRPLYIVLLTDITIVLARLFRERENDYEEVEVEDQKEVKGTDPVKLLERGLAAYQVVHGMFVDCTIYLVVVISGISLI
ncbi:hypothetical protein Tsubulata_035506 [Turnera subulata]|uniref:Transmembrane protein n=1 Tax=Turnera subulata TaxID=218843 RepID=A0A9Q0J4V8_9ROSI|nr:hypothetical protein Tsubulata_035506 [Turnera subulata]